MLTINQERVDPALVDEAFQRIKSEHELKSLASCCERDEEFFALAEEEVIQGILLAQEAEKRHPQLPQDVVRAAYEQTIKDWRRHGASWDLIESQNAQLREETTSALRMKIFADDVCKHLIPPNDEACEAYYRENLHEFFQPPGARVSHLVRFPDPACPWVEHQRLLEIRELVLSGGDFSTLAAEHTAKPDRSVDLGWIDMERATNAFESILFSLREGEISPVISYENAFHLVLVTELRAAVHSPFAEKIETIRSHLDDKQRRGALRSLALELQKYAIVERQSESK